jgi:hypothetical protein
LEFTFTNPEDAIGRIFHVLSAMRFQLIEIAGEVDNLRAAVARLERVEDAPSELNESGH